MKLEINVWDFTGPGSGNVGYATSVILPDANVGHINVLLTIDETEANIDELQSKHRKLNPQKFTTSVPEKVDKQFVEEMNKLSDTLDNVANPGKTEVNSKSNESNISDYSKKNISALEFVNSFWPSETPTFGQMKKGLYDMKSGVEPAFATMQHDRERESDDILINDQPATPKIVHPIGIGIQGEIEALEKRELEVGKKDMALKNERAIKYGEPEFVSLQEKKETLSKELAKVQKEIAACNEVIEKNEASVEFYNMDRTLQKNIKNLSNNKGPVSTTNSEETFSFVYNQARESQLNKARNSIDSLQKQAAEIQKQYDEVQNKILIKQGPIDKLTVEINENKTELTSVRNKINDLKVDLANVGESVGKNPDRTIMVTNEKGENFFDMNAILKEMELQREKMANNTKQDKKGLKSFFKNPLKGSKKNTEEHKEKYSLLGNNCATTAKRCILAGITKEFKNALIKQGVEEKFFKIGSLETPGDVCKWFNKLNEHVAQFRKDGIKLDKPQNQEQEVQRISPRRP